MQCLSLEPAAVSTCQQCVRNLRNFFIAWDLSTLIGERELSYVSTHINWIRSFPFQSYWGYLPSLQNDAKRVSKTLELPTHSNRVNEPFKKVAQTSSELTWHVCGHLLLVSFRDSFVKNSVSFFCWLHVCKQFVCSNLCAYFGSVYLFCVLFNLICVLFQFLIYFLNFFGRPRTHVGGSVTMREVAARIWTQDGVRGFWAGRAFDQPSLLQNCRRSDLFFTVQVCWTQYD